MLKRLFDKFRKRDEQSERLIFEMFYQRVYQTAYYIVQDRDLAQDVVQQTFMKAFKHMHTVHDGEKLGAWLAAIASRTAIDYLRKIKRWNDMATDDVFIDEQLTKNDSYASTVETMVEAKFLRGLLLQENQKEDENAPSSDEFSVVEGSEVISESMSLAEAQKITAFSIIVPKNIPSFFVLKQVTVLKKGNEKSKEIYLNYEGNQRGFIVTFLDPEAMEELLFLNSPT